MTIEITVAISIGAALCGIVFGYLAFRRNSNKDIIEEAKAQGVLLTDIGYIKSGIDDIKRKQTETFDRLIKAESLAIRANDRLDVLEGKEHYIFNKKGDE